MDVDLNLCLPGAVLGAVLLCDLLQLLSTPWASRTLLAAPSSEPVSFLVFTSPDFSASRTLHLYASAATL